MADAIVSPVLPVAERQERSCDSQGKRRNTKMNKFLRLYLAVIGAAVVAERPYLDIEGLNRSLVKTRHAAAPQWDPEFETPEETAKISEEG